MFTVWTSRLSEEFSKKKGLLKVVNNFQLSMVAKWVAKINTVDSKNLNNFGSKTD